MYIHHLENWLKTFPQEQIHVVDGKNLVDRPWDEMRKVEAFLGIRNEVGKREAFYFSAQKGFYCLAPKLAGPLRDGCMPAEKGRKHQRVNLGIWRQLKVYYKPFNDQLFQRLGRTLSWA